MNLSELIRAVEARGRELEVSVRVNVHARRPYPPPTATARPLSVCHGRDRLHSLIWDEEVEGAHVIAACDVPDTEASRWDDGDHKPTCPRFAAWCEAARALAEGFASLARVCAMPAREAL